MHPVRPCRRAERATTMAGFTLIELMVVVAIITMAAGLMIPSLADYFRNRALDGVRSEFTAAFNSARLHAVSGNRSYAVVFFREGVRIYDMARQTWKEDHELDRDGALASGDDLHYDLVFAGMHSRCAALAAGPRECYFSVAHAECLPGTTECMVVYDNLPGYDDWWTMVERGEAGALVRGPAEASAGAGGEARAKTVRFSIDGLVAVIYQRDGIMVTHLPTEVWVYDSAAAVEGPNSHPPISKRVLPKKGNDVPAALYKNEESADIFIWQRGNDYTTFIDLQATGSMRSKVASGEKVFEKNLVGG